MDKNHKYYRHIFWFFLGFLFSFLLIHKLFGNGNGMEPIDFILLLSGFILASLLIVKILALFGFGFSEYYNIKSFIAPDDKKWRHDYYKSLLWAFLGVLIGSALADLGLAGGLYTGTVIGFVFWSGILIWIGSGIFRRVQERRRRGEKKIIGQQVSIKPAMGVVNPDGSVYEPNIDIYFTRRITDDEINIYSNMIQLQKDPEKDRSTIYSIYPERTSMNVYNVTTLQSHDKFISKVKELVEILNNKEPFDHLYGHIEISIRHLWNFGDPQGGATRTYKQVIGNSSNLPNPKAIRSSGDYSTLEEFETALKKVLKGLGDTVECATEQENPNKSSKMFEVKFFN